jgi:hypothetical protein
MLTFGCWWKDQKMNLDNYKILLHDPPQVLLGRIWARFCRGIVAQERWGVLDRPGYGYGILRAAQLARYFGYEQVTICEFGVAHGNGLLGMIELAEKITAVTGVKFRIVGFDTGAGLPTFTGYKEHPEVWSQGDFALVNTDALRQKINGQAELVIGDIQDTVGDFLKTVSKSAPVGFISVDVDLYSASVASLLSLTGPAEAYLPAVPTYFDDVGFYFCNRWCGELAAIEEFNAGNQLRKIDIDRTLPGKRPVKFARWYPQMYACHVLDHPLRQASQTRDSLNMQRHRDYLVKHGIL